MGLQGKKATHDFLSLCTSQDDSFQLHDSKPPPSQGFFLQTHDFLQPLEKPSRSLLAAASAGDRRQRQHQQDLVLPGGVGTFSILHVADAGAQAVKAEPPFVLWGQAAAAEAAGARGHQWALPFAARAVAGAGEVPSSRQKPPEKKGGGGCYMDAGSRSSGGAGFDDDDGLSARREVSSSLKELTVRVEGKGGSCSGSGTDQLPNTPRSKHSATEQRRRSKINDRFQILRDLLPHSDQKRDKASFLLEVIEYIRFLQEKVQKYEASFPEWNQENTKIMPWANVYFRSFWKNAQNKGQIPGDASPDPSQVIRNGSSPGFIFTGKLDDNHNAVASAAASGAQDQAENDTMPSASYRTAETPTNTTNNVTSQPQAQWVRSSGPDDCAVNSEMLNGQDLTIDEGTISLSSQYSQELLTTLSHALQNSGIDLSQASISVQINLGRRAVKRPAAGTTSTLKDLADPLSNNQATGHQLRLCGGAEELSHAAKRLKSDNS